jgi:hypothetical protein
MTEFVEQIYASDEELPDDLKLQALCFLRMYYPEGFQGANETRDWLHNASDQPIHIAITTPNRILASYCAVVRKPLIHAGESYHCWGLTGVLTYPAFRHRGLGTRVVTIGTSMVKDSSADIGMFHCDHPLKHFYESCGWLALENAVTLVGDVNNPEVSSELLMMLFLSDRGRSHQADFDNLPFYFGESTW